MNQVQEPREVHIQEEEAEESPKVAKFIEKTFSFLKVSIL